MDYSGILVIDKPPGFTSHDVVAKLRGICETRKIGHGGTLDPMATGVLPVFVGSAVKAVDLAPNQDKAYEARLLFGTATDTGDITGQVLKKRAVCLSAAQIAAVLPRFLGEQMQTPPLYSAVKVDGKPLYKYAREGKEVLRTARPVSIYSIELLDFYPPDTCTLAAACSKGTYIRTLAEDIGAALGVPATLAGLRRTRAGVFGLADTHSLQAVQAARDAGGLQDLFVDTGRLFETFPRLDVDKPTLARLLNGAPVYGQKAALGRYRLYAGGVFCGLGNVDDTQTLRAEKLFVQRN